MASHSSGVAKLSNVMTHGGNVLSKKVVCFAPGALPGRECTVTV